MIVGKPFLIDYGKLTVEYGSMNVNAKCRFFFWFITGLHLHRDIINILFIWSCVVLCVWYYLNENLDPADAATI